MKSILSLSFWILLNTCLFAQSRGVINCRERAGIPLWEKPGSIVVLRMLSCGQTVPILSLDHGYIKTQINGNLLGYVEAQYVQPLENQGEVDSAAKDLIQKSVGLPQTQEQQIPQLEEPARISIQPPPPAGTQKAAKSYKSDQAQPRRHEAGVYFEISHRKYQEPSLGMQESGMMYGVSGDYTYRSKNFMLKAEGRFAFGDVDYSSPSGEFDGIRDYDYETRFAVGYDLKTASRKASFTPFIGVGYRYLFDGLSKVGSGGYDRKSNYLYSPMGMETKFRLGREWSLGLIGEYDLFWHGWQKSELGDTDPALDTAANDQKGGWGTRASIRITKNIGRIGFAVEPFFRYWNIDKSNIVNITSNGDPTGYMAFEPANSSTEWGTRIGIRF